MASGLVERSCYLGFLWRNRALDKIVRDNGEERGGRVDGSLELRKDATEKKNEQDNDDAKRQGGGSGG